jgi:hypothetical protein
MTLTKVIELTGAGDDIEDVVQQRRLELDMLAKHNIDVDTTVLPEAAPAAAAPAQPSAEDAEDDTEPPDDDGDTADDDDTTNDPQQRVVPLWR